MVGPPRRPRVLVDPRPTEAAQLVTALGPVLAGDAPALAPVPGGEPGRALLAAVRPQDPVADDVALLLPTSGSTGVPKVVELTAAALVASATATHERLGGPGRWVLALPLTHVAGWQVLVRSALAGAAPVVVDAGDTTGLAAAVASLTGTVAAPRRYASLVPTQLARALADPAATAALADLDAVLLGGAAAPAALLALARGSGIAVVATYGSTETSGGCVYDGRPLDGVDVAVAEDGRILLGGAVLARGYRDPDLDDGAFTSRSGRRWFATSDVGSVDRTGTGGTGGLLTVVGRRDDVLVTGGEKVAPAAVEAVLGEDPSLAAVLVVGVDDPEWGQRVVALAVPQPGAALPQLAGVRERVAARLGRAAAPRDLLLVDALPLRGIGKPDRVAAAALAARMIAGTRAPA